MKVFMYGVIGLFTIAILASIALFGSYVSNHNKAVRYEADIEKLQESSKNTLSSYTLKLKEAAKVPDKYVADLRGIVEATFQGRYGEDGSKAAFQWIKEQNIPMDSSMYVKLQTIIDSGRNEFKLSQDKKLELCASYETIRNNFFQGMMISFAGFPKKDVVGMCKIIIDQTTKDKFESGVDAEVVF